MRVHRFLWAKWQRRQVATAEITFFGIDAGNIYTVYIKKDSTGRWTITEYMRHYQVVGTSDEAAKLVATGIALRRFRLRNGVFAVWLVNDQGKTVPMFE